MKERIQRFLRGELIGSRIEAPLKKISGKIIDETKNTFEILTSKKQRKKILKDQEIIFKMKDKKIIVNGKILKIKPEERIKLKLK
jgi:RNase P/RNase MRP subunit p29